MSIPGDAAVPRAERLEVTPAELALAGVLRQHNVRAIPKSGPPAHVQECVAAALGVKLGKDDLDELGLAVSPPLRARRLETR